MIDVPKTFDIPETTTFQNGCQVPDYAEMLIAYQLGVAQMLSSESSSPDDGIDMKNDQVRMKF